MLLSGIVKGRHGSLPLAALAVLPLDVLELLPEELLALELLVFEPLELLLEPELPLELVVPSAMDEWAPGDEVALLAVLELLVLPVEAAEPLLAVDPVGSLHAASRKKTAPCATRSNVMAFNTNNSGARSDGLGVILGR